LQAIEAHASILPMLQHRTGRCSPGQVACSVTSSEHGLGTILTQWCVLEGSAAAIFTCISPLLPAVTFFLPRQIKDKPLGARLLAQSRQVQQALCGQENIHKTHKYTHANCMGAVISVFKVPSCDLAHIIGGALLHASQIRSSFLYQAVSIMDRSWHMQRTNSLKPTMRLRCVLYFRTSSSQRIRRPLSCLSPTSCRLSGHDSVIASSLLSPIQTLLHRSKWRQILVYSTRSA